MNEWKRVARVAGSMRYIVAFTAVLVGAQGWAQGAKKHKQAPPPVEVIILLEKPRLSALPLETEESPLGRRWNALFMQEVAKQQIHMTPEPVVDDFLATQEAGCPNNPECLAALGRTSKAHYVLQGSMSRTEDAYSVSARILQADGIEVKKVGPLQVQHAKNASEDKNAQVALGQLLAELNLGRLNPSPSVSLEEPTIITETVVVEKTIEKPMVLTSMGLRPQTEIEEELKRGPSPMRKASYGLFGAAGAAAIAGTVFAGLADNDFRKYRKRSVDHDSIVVRGSMDLKETQQIRDRVLAYKVVSITTFSMAGAAAIAGTVLFFLSPERHMKSSMKLGLAPTEGGAMLSLEGVLP
ncbi:MAG: hypothetical protein FWD46_05145 [Cystobacterineae bacterium]|nr:hypothetical protein [Cystobacterineae bacterium]